MLSKKTIALITILIAFASKDSLGQSNKGDAKNESSKEQRIDSFENESIKVFWENWISGLKERNVDELIEMTSFPLRNAQLMVHRYDNNGLTKREFKEAFSSIFDEVVIRAFQDSNVQQPNEIDSGVSFETKPKNKKVFSFTVQYMNESEGLDSRMIFFFWEEEGSFKLRYLELIG